METSCRNLVKENQDLKEENPSSDEIMASSSSDKDQLHINELPDSILIQIFSYLQFSDAPNIAQMCHHWREVSLDDLLWKGFFLRYYKLSSSTTISPRGKSWRSEFKRLYYHTPCILSEDRNEHRDEVLHVSFSHNGSMFATCSKDGFFKVWKSKRPATLLFERNMMTLFSWKYTQFSQFNETDTCLLVSGVYFGSLSTSGEIAVFDLQGDFRMQCRVNNKPYDVFGAWYDNDHLLSGTLKWTENFTSVSSVWLSKASQEVESEMESVSMVLYRFENVNSSSIRLLHIAEVETVLGDEEAQGATALPSASPTVKEGRKRRPIRRTDRRNVVPREISKLLRRDVGEDDFDSSDEDGSNGDGSNGDGSNGDDFNNDDFNNDDFNNDDFDDWGPRHAGDSFAWSNFDSHWDLKRKHDIVNHLDHEFREFCPYYFESFRNVLYRCDLPDRFRKRGEDHNDYNGGEYCDLDEQEPADEGRQFHQSLSASDREACGGMGYGAVPSREERRPSRFVTALNERALEYGGYHEGQSSHEAGGEFRNILCRTPDDLERLAQHFGEDASALFDIILNGDKADSNSESDSSSDGENDLTPLKEATKRVANLKTDSKSDGGTKPAWKEKEGAGAWAMGGYEMDSNGDGREMDPAGKESVAGPTATADHKTDSNSGDRETKSARKEVVGLAAENNNDRSEVSDFIDNATQTEEACGPSGAAFQSLPQTSCGPGLSSEFCKSRREKLLIYTWGSETYIPHKIGIKRIKPSDFNMGTRKTSTLLPDVRENLDNVSGVRREIPDGSSEAFIQPDGRETMFNTYGTRRDVPDVSIDMHGHIVGLSLSPDQRYLYVNCRSWPKNCVITDPQESLPLAQEVEIFTIDLTTFQFTGPVLRSHKAYTDSDKCFFLNLDVSENYVVSGAEDKRGYLWDRHYGIPLYHFEHKNVVNSMAINPRNPEMAISASDDHTFKIWLSRRKMKKYRESKKWGWTRRVLLLGKGK